MNTGIQHMNTANWFQLVALFVTLATLIWQQRHVITEEQRKEKRIETKLRIYYAIGQRDLGEEEIISALAQGQPLKETNNVEIRKALYEMLSDETIRFTKERKYTAVLIDPIAP